MIKLHLKVNDKITLKVPEVEDAHFVFELIDKNRNHLETFMQWESKTNSVQDVLSYFDRNKHLSYYDNDFPLIVRYENEIIGIIGYNKGNSIQKTVDLGYWIGEDFTKKGIVTKCCQALINFAFAMTDIEKIYIKCDLSNSNSYNIAMKLGFEFVEQVKDGSYVKNGQAEMISFELKKPIVL